MNTAQGMSLQVPICVSRACSADFSVGGLGLVDRSSRNTVSILSSTPCQADSLRRFSVASALSHADSRSVMRVVASDCLPAFSRFKVSFVIVTKAVMSPSGEVVPLADPD